MKHSLNWTARITGAFVAVLLLGAALPGGFELSVELPDAAAASKAEAAVLVVRARGCHHPEKAEISATAEGMVAGKRESRKLKLQPVSPGAFGISQQWPSEGRWILAITGTYRGQTSSALVELGPGGAVTADAGRRVPVRVVRSKLSPRTVETALASAAK